MEGGAQTLWCQLDGLVSAVEYLNNECRTVYRDIKPFNIMLYHNDGDIRLLAKITDFGLAISSDGARTYNSGTTEAQSALKYDAPEIGKYAEDLGIDIYCIPSPWALLNGDIWKMLDINLKRM